MAWSDTSRASSVDELPQLSMVRAALIGYSRSMRFGGWSGFSSQIMLLLPPALLYFLVRDLSAGQEREAFANAADIVGFQKALGLDWEATLQQRVLDTDWIIAGVNWIYIWGHFPLILGVLLLSYRMSRRDFLTLRNALVASGAIGLVCFALYPVAPPRLFEPSAFFDSIHELSSSYRVLQNPKVTNQFAAVPSFHVGWNLLVAITIWRASRFRPLKVIAVASPVLMISAVVLTANHWLIDVFAGIGVALLGITAAHFMDRLFCRIPNKPTITGKRPSAPTRAPLIAPVAEQAQALHIR